MNSATNIQKHIGFVQQTLFFVGLGTLSMQGMQLTARAAQPEVLSLLKASVGEQIVFRVAVRRPEDMGTMTIEQQPWRSQKTVWPRLASLVGEPQWNYPCYLEYERPEPRQPVSRLDRLTFIGRCPDATSLELSLRYPTTDGSWRTTPLVLDLGAAGQLTGNKSPRQSWAAAQAEWFRILGEYAGDVGGFFAYAAQQTRRKFGLPLAEVPPRRSGGIREPEEVEYGVISGALAIQEALQLDRMANPDRDRGERKVLFGDIPAVAVKAHPFAEMRGGKDPIHGKLAALVPEDHYFLRFRSVARLLELLDFSDQWGGSLLRLAKPVGTDHGTRARTLQQLCLPDNILARLLGPAVISEIAVSGSDPYLVNGSDVTVLFHVHAKEAFQAAVDLPFSHTKQENSAARHDETTYQGVRIERLVDARRRVSCHRCWIDDVCLYSNSLTALKRIIDAAQGSKPNLAEAGDFKYMRAVVFPLDNSVEDGFLYLSDPFIRRLVGPEVRIKQKRRLGAATSLKMLTNAAIFHGYQHGPSRPTFEQLVANRSLNADDLYGPEDGVITWDAESGEARSSACGDVGFLKPVIEFDSELATEKEAEAYGRFRDRYQQYWRRFFDPIGIRFRIDKKITLETHILPLIDSSKYNEMADVAGGEPITVRTSLFSENTLLRYVMHLNDGNQKAQYTTMLGSVTGTNTTSDWLGDWVTFWIEDTDAFGTLVRRQYESGDRDQAQRTPNREIIDVFDASFVLGVHVKNKVSLAVFLVALKTMVTTAAPNTVVFRPLEPYHDITIVQIGPDPSGTLARQFQSDEPEPENTAEDAEVSTVSERGPALYYATIEDGFYISTQPSSLRSLIDRLYKPRDNTPVASADVNANVLLFVAPRAAELARPSVAYFLEQQARQISWRNLAQVWMLGRCGLLQDRSVDDSARAYLGYGLVCPDGGTYRYDASKGTALCSVHGTLEQPVRHNAPPPSSPLGGMLETIDVLTAHLRFTQEGIATQVNIDRR